MDVLEMVGLWIAVVIAIVGILAVVGRVAYAALTKVGSTIASWMP
jgi:hypothetical protein